MRNFRTRSVRNGSGGGCVSGQLITIPNQSASAFAFIQLGVPTSRVMFAVAGGNLLAQNQTIELGVGTAAQTVTSGGAVVWDNVVQRTP